MINLQQLQEMQDNIEGLIAGLIIVAFLALAWLIALSCYGADHGYKIKELDERVKDLEGGVAPITETPYIKAETPTAGDIGEQAILKIRQERRRVEAFKRQMGNVTPDEALFLERQLERRINAIKADFDATINTRKEK